VILRCRGNAEQRGYEREFPGEEKRKRRKEKKSVIPGSGGE